MGESTEPRESRPPFSLKRTAEILVQVRQTFDWTLVVDKDVVFIAGESEDIRDFVQAMKGGSQRDGRPKRCSSGVISCPLGVYVSGSGSVVYGDTGPRGLPDEIVDAICIRQAWQQAARVKPVCVISYHHIKSQRAADLASLLEGYAQMLGYDQEAIEQAVYVIHHIPKDFNKYHEDLVVSFFNLMSEFTDIGDGAFSVACAIVNQLSEKKVIYFDPTNFKFIRECARRIKSIDAITPNEVAGQFSLSPAIHDILRSDLNETVAHVHCCLREGKSAELLDHFKTLELLADELPLVKSTLEEVKTLVSEETIKYQQKAMAILKDVSQSLDYWTSDLSQVNTALQLASDLVDLEGDFSEDYMPLKTLEASITRTVHGIVERSQQETQFSVVCQLYRKLNRLMDVIELRQSWDPLREISREVMKDRINLIITTLQGFQIPEDHASEEEIHRDYTKFCRLIDDLRQGEVHLGPLIPEDVSMDPMTCRSTSVAMLTAQLREVQETFGRRAVTGQAADEHHLKRLFCILRVAASHANLRSLTDPAALKDPLQQAKEQTMARVSETLKNLQDADVHQLTSLQILERIDPFFQEEITQLRACLFQSRLEDLPVLEANFRSKLTESPTDGEGLQNLYRQVEARLWMDEFPNMNRVKETLNKMEEMVLNRLRQIQESQSRTVAGGDRMLKHCIMLRELDCFVHVDSIAEMIEKITGYFFNVITELKNHVDEVCENPRADHTPVSDEATSEVITFKQAERYLGQLFAFQSSAELLGIPIHREIESLQALFQRKAETLVQRISRNRRDFETMAAILEALRILPTLSQKIVPAAALDAHRKGLVALQHVLTAIEREVETLIAVDRISDAQEQVELFAQYPILLPALSTVSLDLDLPNREKELRVKLRSNAMKAEQHVEELYDAGDYDEIRRQRSSAHDDSKYRWVIQRKIDRKMEELRTLLQQLDIRTDHVDHALLLQISSTAQGLERSKRFLGMEDIRYHETDLSHCYGILDQVLSQAVKSNIDQLRNGELRNALRFHNQLWKCCDQFGRTVLPITLEALRYFQDVEADMRTVSEEDSLLKLESRYRQWKDQPYLLDQIAGVFRAKLQKESTEIVREASRSPDEAFQRLAQLKFDTSSVMEAELIEIMDAWVAHTEYQLNAAGQKVQMELRTALNTNNIPRLTHLKQAYTDPSFSRQFDDMVTDKLSQMQDSMESAVEEEDLEMFCALGEQYKCLEALFPYHGGEAFQYTNSFTLLRKKVQHHLAVTENQHVDGSQIPPEYTPAVSYLFRVYRHPLLRTLVDENMLIQATAPVQRALAPVCYWTSQGCSQYDLDLLCRACDASKTFADLISVLKKETFPDQLSMLQACCKFKSYGEVREEVEMFVHSLPSIIEGKWRELHDAKPIVRCVKFFLSPRAERLQAHVPDIKDIHQQIETTCTVICSQVAMNCTRAYRNSDPEFSTWYRHAMKLQCVEEMMNGREIENLDAMIKADINERIRELKTLMDIPTLVAGLKELALRLEDQPRS